MEDLARLNHRDLAATSTLTLTRGELGASAPKEQKTNIIGASFLMFWPSESYSFLRSLSSTDKLHIYIHVYSYSLSRSDFHNIRSFLSLGGIVEVCCWWLLSTKSAWQSVSTHLVILTQWCFPYTGKYIWTCLNHSKSLISKVNNDVAF